MNDYAESIRESHAIVWRYRAELQDVWPTPPPEDALRFAFTEAAEALDAWLRLKGGYARNNDKSLSVEDELADCAMMLLTAVGEKWERGWTKWIYDGADSGGLVLLDSICFAVAWSLDDPGNALDAVILIAAYIGADELPARITARLERIKAKRSINREG